MAKFPLKFLTNCRLPLLFRIDFKKLVEVDKNEDIQIFAKFFGKSSIEFQKILKMAKFFTKLEDFN